jgi:undecaprenyl-diphosphatase
MSSGDAVKTLTDRITDRWGRWVVPYAALWITMLIGGVIVVALAVMGAEVYDNVVDDAGLANLDKPALALSEDLRTPWLNSAVTASPISAAGSGCRSSAAS